MICVEHRKVQNLFEQKEVELMLSIVFDEMIRLQKENESLKNCVKEANALIKVQSKALTEQIKRIKNLTS